MKRNYMTQLERWARWMLPHQEADDVIADYRDIVGTPPRPEAELLHDLGKPRDVIKPLTQKKPYYTWLAVFTVMAVCILAPGISPTVIGYPIWILLFDGWVEYPYGAYLTTLGAVLALVWFRCTGRKTGPLPRTIPVLLAVFLLCIGGVIWFCWACSRDFDAFLEMWGTTKAWIGPNTDISRSFYLFRYAMAHGSTIISFIGAFGLVKARVGDRRWAAVYVLAATAMLTALLVVDWSGRMDTTFTTPEELFRQMLSQCSGVAAAGLIGTGVALC